MKYGKSAGIDDVLVEQINNIGPTSHKWLPDMLNKCLTENKAAKLRRLMIIAMLKPVKDSTISKNCIPISLLCHTYKLYERLIYNGLAPMVE